VFKNYYQGKKVFITGHTGFKGGWLSFWLKQLGAEVKGYALAPCTEPNFFNALGLEKEIQSEIGNIRDEAKLKKSIEDFKPEIIFHLAAQPLVRRSYLEPKLTFETNIMGTINLFEAVRQVKSVKTVINITSDKCYENKEWVYGYRENDPMGGYDPYSSSKGCAELVTASYRNSFFHPDDYGKKHTVALASVRAGNVIGGGDWSEDRLIPDCIKAFIKNETVIIRSPNATRPWELVLEPLSGYLWLGALLNEDPKKYSGGWNFGPADKDIWTVERVVSNICKIWKTGKYEIVLNTDLHEAKLLKLDVSKAHFYLKWHPVYHAEKAIEETVKWYQNYYEAPSNIKKYTLEQLKNYSLQAKSLNLIWTE